VKYGRTRRPAQVVRRTTLVQSLAPRPINRCSEAPAGHTNRCRELPPSANRVGSDVADPSAFGNSAHIAGRVNLVRAAPSHTRERPLIWRLAGLAAPETLIDRPETGSGGGWSSRGACTPQPRRAPDLGAGWTEPFAPPLGVSLLPSSEHYRRSSREAPSGLLVAPAGPRVPTAPGGEDNGAAAEHEQGDLVLRSFDFAVVVASASGRRSFRGETL